ncbi:MAG: hypothetical protein ACI841_000761, partial [Planctomycetota bacterium]
RAINRLPLFVVHNAFHACLGIQHEAALRLPDGADDDSFPKRCFTRDQDLHRCLAGLDRGGAEAALRIRPYALRQNGQRFLERLVQFLLFRYPLRIEARSPLDRGHEGQLDQALGLGRIAGQMLRDLQ